MNPEQPTQIKTDHCRVCGRYLKTKESRDKGMGPVCARKQENFKINEIKLIIPEKN